MGFEKQKERVSIAGYGHAVWDLHDRPDFAVHVLGNLFGQTVFHLLFGDHLVLCGCARGIYQHLPVGQKYLQQVGRGAHQLLRRGRK